LASVDAAHSGLSKDGFEVIFAVNHLAHFILTDLLIPKLKESAPSRIVTVSSKASFSGTYYNLAEIRNSTQNITIKKTLALYGQSKLANVMHSAKLSKDLAGSGVTCYSLHPGVLNLILGVVATDIWRNIPWIIRAPLKMLMISEDKGCDTQIFCATNEALKDETGFYYDNSKRCDPPILSEDVQQRESLCSFSAQLITDFRTLQSCE
jgi:retinol dehydrogenase-12